MESTKEIVYFATDGASRNNGKENARASWAFCCATKEVALGNLKLAFGDGRGAKDVIKRMTAGEFAEGIDFFNGLVEESPGLPKPSNNRGELTAMLKCLEYILEHRTGKEIFIVSDSEYTIKSIDVWSRKWILDPSKLRGKLNLDLINVARETLDKVRQKNKISFKHIHSHKKIPEDGEMIEWYFNLLADLCCQKPLSNDDK